MALAALVACAAAIPAGYEMQVKQRDTGHRDRPILWGALVGPPAARKTPVLNEAVRPLKAIEEEWIREDEPKLRAHERELAQRKKSAQKSREPEPECPRRRRKIVNDTTVEALGLILRDNPNGVLSYTDELSGWIGGMDAYKPGKATSKDQPFWLQAKQGNAYTVDRVTRNPVRVARAAIHVLGGIQPDVIRKFASDFSGNGMLQRFLLVIMGPSKRSLDRAPGEASSRDWHEAIATLARLHDSDLVPLFRFSPEADIYRQEIEAFRDQLLDDPDTPPSLQGWIGKTESEWARIALVFHLLQWADAPLGDVIPPAAAIDADSAERAARLLMEWQYPNQRHFYQSIIGSAATANAHALNVAGYILAHDLRTIAERDINRNCSGLKTARKHGARLAAMRVLELNGWVEVSGSKRNEPNKWRVNPSVHDGRFKPRAEAEQQRREAAREGIAEAAAARRAAKGAGANDGEPDREAA